MGKKSKEHRKKVQKRNQQIQDAQNRFKKTLNQMMEIRDEDYATINQNVETK